MRHRIRFVILALAGLTAIHGAALAGELEVSGSVAGELRGFLQGPQFPGQFNGLQPSAILTPEFEFDVNEGRDQFTFLPYLRLDPRDSRRSHFDIREAYWRHIGEGWELVTGLNRVFWGVTESRHLVDVINQTDFVENIDEEDKLGQPMVNLNLQRNWGTLSLFVLPGFRERTFPSAAGRQRFPLPVDTARPVYESAAGNKHVDYAARYSQFFGNWDIGASYFRGTGREPRLIPNAGQTALIPHYDLVNQGGLDVQYTKDAWLWKFEGIVRGGQGKTFAAAVGGFEYTLYQLGGSAADLGILLEYQFDGRDHTAPFTTADDDVFFGVRFALNDTQNSQLLAGAIVDRQHGSTAILIEAERRLGEQFLVEFESRLFVNTSPDHVLYTFRRDHSASVRFSWFF